MPSSRRCVFGCVTKGITVHRFPNPAKFPEQFRTWVELGGEQLKNLSVEEVYPRLRVCDKHFIESHRNRNNRLNSLAIPTLHLPRASTVVMDTELESVQIEVPCSSQQLLSESHPDQNVCEASAKVPTEDNTNLSLHMPVLSLDQGASTVVMDTELESVQIEVPSSSQQTLSGLHVEKSIGLEVEEGSAKHNMPRHNNFPSSLSLPDAVIGLNNDHDYCTRSREKSSATKQIREKPSMRRKMQGSRGKTLNMSYYKEFERKTRNLRREILRLKKRCKSFKSRLEDAIKMSNSKAFHKVTANMTLPAKIFTGMQFREAKKKPKGRRFTLEEKILSLSFYKRSPKAYTLLHKSFTLPSSKSLRNLLGKIKIGPGINKLIFKKMSNTVASMNDADRLCIVMFDEMSINPQVHYDASSDTLKGFSTIGNENKIADHALNFMIRGIKKNYKQPVAYYFTQNLNKIELKNCIKEVVRHVKSTGLKVVATVCDQSSVNVGAIESLIQETKETYIKKGHEWRNDLFMVEKTKIIPLYDVPHLIKGLRNNLITKDLKYVDFEDENKEKILKWEYFQQLYEADKCQGELKYLLKLTEEHINPEKINKMKVKTATQLFSHTVAVAAKHLTATGELDPACRQITPIVKVIDNLFDSLNCNTFGIINGKIFRAGVKRNSPHHKLWQDSLKFFKNMKFLENKKDGSKIKLIEKIVPSVKKFTKTIEGMQAIWKVLHEKYSFDTMLCRNFNQDPIENFFGSVRSLGVRNISPNTISFEGAFKSLLLNNFSSSHSLNSNCEEDVCTFLQSVDFLIKESAVGTDNIAMIEEENEKLEQITLNEEVLHLNDELVIEGIGQKMYVCGWVLKKCSKIIKNCQNCKKKLFAADSEHIPAHAFIREKEYCNKNWLCYPSMECIKCFNEISYITTHVLKKNLNIKNLKKNIKTLNSIFINYNNIFDCNNHQEGLRTLFEDLIINVTVYSWCRSINRILSGKISYDGDDETKLCAQIYFNKHKHKNKK